MFWCLEKLCWKSPLNYMVPRYRQVHCLPGASDLLKCRVPKITTHALITSREVKAAAISVLYELFFSRH